VSKVDTAIDRLLRVHREEVTHEAIASCLDIIESYKELYPEAAAFFLDRLKLHAAHPNQLRARILDVLSLHPHWPVGKIVEATGASKVFIYQVRQEVGLSAKRE